MSFPQLQASYYSEPYEWITTKEIKEYVSISKDCCKYGRKRVFPDLHISKETSMHGVKLYTFNSVDDVKFKLSEKVLHHFYYLCDVIFGAMSEVLPIFFARPMMKGKCAWGIPKRISTWAMERGFRNDYGGFTCYL